MSQRNDGSWLLLSSIETPDGERCVDFFQRLDGTFGFEEFRRDPEDLGAWTAVAFHSARVFSTLAEAEMAAAQAVSWLEGRLSPG